MSRLLNPTAVALALVAAACGAARTESHPPAVSTHATAQARVTYLGFSLAIPADWHTGTSQNDDGAAYLTTASSPVDSHEAGLGVGSQHYMQPGDVLVSVTEVKAPPDPPGFQQLDGAPRVSRGQLGHYAVPAPAMWIEDYAERGRYFQIGVAFGRERPTDEQLRTANDVLSSFVVRPT
jgi:hypothetical protein